MLVAEAGVFIFQELKELAALVAAVMVELGIILQLLQFKAEAMDQLISGEVVGLDMQVGLAWS
jgi:hypothetical protein